MTHKHVTFGHLFMIKDERKELAFIKQHYAYPKKPFSTDQHVMFVNVVEDYGLGGHPYIMIY